jgi:energy-coupling factor transporter ATP-binding protein EcfA2
MRIIGLYGHGNCGKSETLNALKELLREKGKSISAKPHPWSEMPETFEYKKLVVCVAPGGDDGSKLKENIRYFKAKKCDVAITATRCKGGPVEELQKYAKSEDVEIEWIQKSYEYNLSKETQTQCNKETAEVIMDLIYY